MHIIIKLLMFSLITLAAYQGYQFLSGWEGQADSPVGKLLNLVPITMETLTVDNFRRKVLGSREAWLVDFYAPWCSHCKTFDPEFDKAARTLRFTVRVGKVNCDSESFICKNAGIDMYPSVMLYPGFTDSEEPQDYKGVEVYEREVDDIAKFVWNTLPKHQALHDEH